MDKSVLTVIIMGLCAITFIGAFFSCAREEKTGIVKTLVAYDQGGFMEDAQATFDDGIIVFNPAFDGGIQIGAKYELINCYNVFGIKIESIWRKIE